MGREGSGSCIPGEAWLGMYTRGLQPDVKCFKIYQCLVEGCLEMAELSWVRIDMDLEHLEHVKLCRDFPRKYMGVSKNRGGPSKMDGENNGSKPY